VKKKLVLAVALLASASLLLGFTACGQSNQKPRVQTPEETLAKQNNSIVLGEVLAIREQPGGGYAEIDLKVVKSMDVPGVKNNSTKDKVGKVITVLTSEFVAAINVGELVVCYVTLSAEGQQGVYVAKSFFPGKLPD